MPLPVALNPSALDLVERAQAEARPMAEPGFDAMVRQATEQHAPSGPRQVKAARTQLSGEEAAQALTKAWSNVTGEAPKRETIAILAAQWAHETGRGASMYNYNFGGIKGTGPSGLTVHLKTREGWGASERRIVDGFRAYRTAEEGATDFVKLLTRRYGAAVDAAEQGDPVAFVRGLKNRGYFTGNETAYARSVDSLSRAAMAQGFSALGPGGHVPVDVTRAVEAPRGETTAGFDPGMNYHGTPPFVDAMTIADEISRAALRIAAHNARDSDERG